MTSHTGLNRRRYLAYKCNKFDYVCASRECISRVNLNAQFIQSRASVQIQNTVVLYTNRAMTL